MTTPHGGEVGPTLHALTLRLDDTRDLLEAAAQHLTTLEVRLRRHDITINDLHWDAARILTSDNPAAAASPDGHRTLRAVQDGSAQLVQDLGASAAAASTSHTLLTSARRQLGHAQRLIGELGDVGGEALATEVAVLATRTERLAALIEGAVPLGEGAQLQLGEAQEILQRQVGTGTTLHADRFQRFWAVDVGIFDGSRAVSQARTSTRDGAELLERAVHTGTLTAVQARTTLRQHTPLPHHEPPPSLGRPPQPAPASDRPDNHQTTRPPDELTPPMSHTRRRFRHTGTRTGTRTWGAIPESDLRRPGGGARPSPSRPRRHPDPRQPCTFVEHPPQPDPLIDAIASQLTGQKINAGIALIDTDWAAGKSLESTLAGLTRIARAASLQYTAGLWTLIAWINWRTNDRPAAWDALDLALDIDPDEDPADYLAVLMHDQVDPRRIRPVHWL